MSRFLLCCRQKAQQDRLLYKQGKRKIENELDIRTISRELRTLKFMSKILMTRHQRELIPQFKENLINYAGNKNNSQISVKEAIDETIENSVRCEIDRRIIKHIDFDQDNLMHSLSKLIGSMADSNQVILKVEDL